MIGHRNCVVVVLLMMLLLLILDRWNNGRRGLEMMMMIGVVGGGELMLDSSMIHRCGRGTAVATGKMKRFGFTSIQSHEIL